MSEIEDLKAALALHNASRPDSLSATRPDAPTHVRQAWEMWLKTKWDLQTQLDMAKSADMNQWRDSGGRVVRPAAWAGNGLYKDLIPGPIKRDPGRPARATMQELLERLNAEIAAMKALEPASAEWNELRAKAVGTRNQIVNRVREEEMRVNIPIIPRLSDLSGKQSERRREYDRARKAKLRAIKAQRAMEAAK